MIEAIDISKRFLVRSDRSKSVAGFLKSGFRRQTAEEVWALRDVSLNIKKGERVAILGHNGAGKSTFLSLISGTLLATSGTLKVEGTVAPMVGFTTGFDARLSGRDNLFLRAALFGLTKRETESIFDQVVEFAELEDFIDRPVETYSSGMKARLGFSLSMHLKADIYLLDEALSAGDAAFRKKASEALAKRVASDGTWVIVTHSPDSLRELCDRAFLFGHGKLLRQGPFDEICEEYEAQ